MTHETGTGKRREARLARIVIPLLCATLPWFGACGRHTAEDEETDSIPHRGGTVVLGSISDVDSWNEYVSREGFANTVLRRIYLRLARDRTGGAGDDSPYEPELAESWWTSDDGLSVSFRLREATWSDGKPIRAGDVRFTWKAQTAPEVAWLNVTSKEHITDVEVLDDRTVTFHFDRAYPDQMADAIEGGILPEHAFAEVPLSEWRTHDWSTVRMGSGPFLLDDHRQGEEITLVRNPAYYDDANVHLDQVVIRVVPDAGNLLTQLLAGSVDYMENIPPWDAERVRADGATLIAFDYPRYDYIGWNANRPPFDDAMVRRALTLAIDRQAIVEDLLYGFGRISAGPIPSFMRGADPEIEPWPYDPELARRILSEKGYRPGHDDGTLEKDGKPLEFALTTNAGNRRREAVIVKIQEQLGRIGVRARPQTLEMKTFRHRVRSGDYDAFVGGWVFLGTPPIEDLFASHMIAPAGMNVVGYRSADVDRWCDELDAATDWNARKEILSRIQGRIHEDQPYTFLYEAKRLAGVSPRLKGVEIKYPADPLAFLENAWVTP